MLTPPAPSFAGRPINLSNARRLVERCEGDTLADFGRVPEDYSLYEREAKDWGTPVSFASGYMYVVVGTCARFDLYILSDDETLLALEETEIYCGYPVVTRILGENQEWSYGCDDEGESVRVVMRWRFFVKRMNSTSGALEKVLRARIHAECWMANVGRTEGDRVSIEYYVEHDAAGYERLPVTAAADSRWPASGIPPLWPDLFIEVSATEGGCVVIGQTVRLPLDYLFWILWSSEVARDADASGRFVGPMAVGVSHACYLLRGSPILEDCADWLEAVCRSCPIDCDDAYPFPDDDEHHPDGGAGQDMGGGP